MQFKSINGNIIFALLLEGPSFKIILKVLYYQASWTLKNSFDLDSARFWKNQIFLRPRYVNSFGWEKNQIQPWSKRFFKFALIK